MPALAVVKAGVVHYHGGVCIRDLEPLLHLLALLIALLNPSPLPPCDQRPHFVDPPWVDGRQFCLELVIDDPTGGALGFTALAAAPDGTLYAARPLYGQVWALTDDDGDGLPETARPIAEGLTRPNGLAWHDGALYISGGPHLYRLRDGDLAMLVDDLPAGGGFWTGGVTVGPDDRLYVATGAPCDFCDPVDATRGAILSFDRDGGDRRVVAAGLRAPVGLTWHAGTLWVVDSARDGLYNHPADLDELNRVTEGAHFGWPGCIGANQPDPARTPAPVCADFTAPALTFPTGSRPLGLASYTGDALPALAGDLLLVLGGSYNQIALRGYALAAIRFEDGAPTGYRVLIPDDPVLGQFTLEEMNYRTSGFWPRYPFAVTVSPEGWLYISVGGGRIYALRPA